LLLGQQLRLEQRWTPPAQLGRLSKVFTVDQVHGLMLFGLDAQRLALPHSQILRFNIQVITDQRGQHLPTLHLVQLRGPLRV
jgi:hypothetical protein